MIAFVVHALLIAAIGVAIGCAAVLFERLSGERLSGQGRKSYSWWAGATSASAFMSIGMIEHVWDAIGVGGLVALGVLAQFGIVAWRQRWRESHLYRDTLEGTDSVPGSLDPTATTKEFG